MSYQEKVTESQQEISFKRILKKSYNQVCAECSAISPTWVSLDFGVFVCMNCSGAHRALSPSVTRVRSTRLDEWIQENIDIMDNIGNKMANEYWEYKLKPQNKPTSNWSLDDIIKFVYEKYVKKTWAQPGIADPKTRYSQSLISGVPFNTPISQTTGLPPRNLKVNQKQSMMDMNKNQMKAFYSDNGSGKQWGWNETEDPTIKFKTYSGVQPQQQQQVDIDLLSSGRNKAPTNNFPFVDNNDDFMKSFKSTPGYIQQSNRNPQQESTQMTQSSQQNVHPTKHQSQQQWQQESIWSQTQKPPLPQTQQTQNQGQTTTWVSQTPPMQSWQPQVSSNIQTNWDQPQTEQTSNNQNWLTQQPNQSWQAQSFSQDNQQQNSQTSPTISMVNQNSIQLNWQQGGTQQNIQTTPVIQGSQTNQLNQVNWSMETAKPQQPQNTQNSWALQNQKQNSQNSQNVNNQMTQFNINNQTKQPTYQQPVPAVPQGQNQLYDASRLKIQPLPLQGQNTQSQEIHQQAQQQFKNNPFATVDYTANQNQTQNIMSLYSQQNTQQKNNYDYLKNNPFH